MPGRLVLIVALLWPALPIGGSTDHAGDGGANRLATRAVAVLTPTDGNTAFGAVNFEQRGDAVMVTADVSGLSPNREHAWHIHEFGDIRSADGTATGGHFNPEGLDHGLPPSDNRHAGDFGNLRADGNGRAQMVLTVDNITVAGPRNAILGRGLIIHAERDDGGQPAGNAGARIAQGVIGVVQH